MKTCARCGLPETYETIEFDANGVCLMCLNSDKKVSVDWATKEKEFEALIESYRGRYDYDCIVPFSGGKDSVYVLWRLVTKYHLKPLVVQYNHGFLRAGLLANNERVLKQLGVDFLSFQANWKLIKRTMLEALIRKGDTCWSCHCGVFAYPMHIALKYQVPLVIWGETSSLYNLYYQEGETEEVDQTRFDRFVNLGISADDMRGMIARDSDFDLRDLKPFTYPPTAELRKLGVRSVCYGSYFPWDAETQTETIKRELGWKGDQVEGLPDQYNYTKLECTMQGLRDWAKWLKRGYGRVTQMTAIDRRLGRMDEATATALIAEYEGKRPASLDIFLGYMGITEKEFNEAILATVVPPHVPDFNAPTGKPVHDMDNWYREWPSANVSSR